MEYQKDISDRKVDLPPLSFTFQATQLLTPAQLERITIDQPHYQGHLLDSVATTKPPEKNAVQRRVGKMGDNYFFLQKEIPVEQSYSRTALQLSQVRPWDQILERPLRSANMVSKEINLPFPQEHPYTSHISRFAVFPDTSQAGTMVDAQTQTCGPPSLYEVSQKALEKGIRVESRYPTTEGVDMTSGSGTMLWDLPRSQRHKRAYTYPAPSHQYSRPPTAPRYLPLPSTIKQSRTHMTPSSQMALKRIHQVLTRTTTYAEQYPAPNTPRGIPNVLQTSYSFRSRISQRPWTAESRGKYNRVAIGTLSGLDASASLTRPRTMKQIEDNSEIDSVSASNESSEQDTTDEGPTKFDASTQTEDEYFATTPTKTELPPLFLDSKLPGDEELRLSPAEQPNIDTFSRQYTPRSKQSSRKLMTLFNGFNKTDVLKRFHGDFPEETADLREYSVHEGKRHFIHGSHAYYYH